MTLFRSIRKRIGFAVGDVSGKGLASALLMASLQGLVRMNLTVRQREVARFVTELNDSMYNLTPSNRYATFFFAVVDVSGPTIHYVNAGHSPPLLFRSGTSSAHGTTKRLNSEGFPVGRLPQCHYGSERFLLNEGDVLARTRMDL